VNLDVKHHLANMDWKEIEDILFPYPPVDRFFWKILNRIYRKTGYDFRDYRLSTLRRRIGRQLMRSSADNYKEFDHQLSRNMHECDRLVGNITINVSEFYRNPEYFDKLIKYLKEAPWFQKEKELKIDECRIWIAGCAAGEEAYSIGISLHEMINDHLYVPKLDFNATDIDVEALKKATRAVYARKSIINVNTRQLQRHFHKRKDNNYQLDKKILDIVKFSHHNLVSDPPLKKQHMVVCRNVIIYFRTYLQEKVLMKFARALQPGGYLWLGKSECLVGDSRKWFEIVDRKIKLYKRNTRLFFPDKEVM